MKKFFIALALMLTLANGSVTMAQKHRHSQQTVLVDSASNNAIEAYSDTTSVVDDADVNDNFDADDTDDDSVSVLSAMRDKDIAGIIFVIAVLLIIFVLSPVLIIVALFYFVNKSRKQKIELAQMAMKNGQAIPEQLLKETKSDDADETYRKGVRQSFLGIGLMIFLYYTSGTIGFGVGALVFCIGLGKIFSSKWNGRRAKDNDANINDITTI